jgi:hypothetical protein
VQAIGARAGEGAVAHLDDVFSVFRHNQRGDAVLPDEGVVVAGTQFEPRGVHDRHVGVEQRRAQANRLDLDVDAVSLFRLHDEVIDVFTADVAVDRDVQRDRLRRGEFAVGFLLIDLGEGADEKRAQFGQPGGGTQTHAVAAQFGFRRDLEFRLDRRRILDLELGDLDPAFVEQKFLRVFQAGARQGDVDFGAALPSARNNGTERRRSGRQPRRRQRERECQTERNETEISCGAHGSASRGVKKPFSGEPQASTERREARLRLTAERACQVATQVARTLTRRAVLCGPCRRR